METAKAEQKQGAFASSLRRNNAKIREDRATAIVETAELLYKRFVEDLTVQLKALRREQEGLMDLSPTTADSLTLASDFNAQKYVTTDVELGVKIRNTEIKLEVAQKRYAFLFGEAQ